MNELVGADTGRWIGTHALGLYFTCLCALWFALVACYFINRRSKQENWQHSVTSAFYVPAGIIACCLLAFSAIAFAIAHTEALSRFDAALSGSIAMHTPPAARRFFASITHAGDTLTYTILCIVATLALLLRKRILLAFATVIAIGGNSILNRSLKAIFERVRPVHEQGLIERGLGEYPMAMADGWSFPSGHTSGAVVTYGMLAFILLRLAPKAWHPAILLLAVSLVFTIASSRVFLQVHYMSDVIAGFFSGLCWLTICIAGIRLADRRGKVQYSNRMTAG